VAEDNINLTKGDISVLDSFKLYRMEMRADLERKKRESEKLDKDLKLQELKQFAKTLKHRTPIPSDRLALAADEEEDESAEEERLKADQLLLAKKRAEGLRDFSRTFKLRSPVPEDSVSVLANDPVKQQEIIAQEKRASLRVQLSEQRRYRLPGSIEWLQDSSDRTSEALTVDKKVSSAKSLPASSLQAQDPSIIALRPAPPLPHMATESWAAAVAAGEGQAPSTTVSSDNHRFEPPASKKGKRRKKRRAPNAAESSHNDGAT
jgi:hypothetical protein